ncbi:MAG TPA: bifunctional hydroxymethylpyrimidine kinase/phosphomethylpyrimidine kinase [Pusillimonas sp.]|uniref:bifunctional hydroxymethylpyrimidine kinase/phosphomethylpyrimidine kinase n=1 Tax=Pusillimonas sp. TaxID=3040095 RepID=UPI002B558647|nr:bifunctional hydroxymethylpyrimidine kinase/phosphomethylpyrimidine kinase [Pusillimonas sp.]HUH88964.1 bifunctional hydroxymethylpyrimidine kinase/phosphomethylpyrimidine kinase [Pusillimonas sp.]
MLVPDPSLVLFFEPFDPSGSSNLPADAVSCAALGGHALSVVTAIHVQDTAGIEDIHAMSPEFIDDQARCLLEDMNVQAIKAGPLYSTDAVRVLAQIAADYSHLPLVLQLGAPLETNTGDDTDPEEVLDALFELLLPQANLVIAEHGLLTHWQSDGILSTNETMTPAQLLLKYGAQWVMTTGAPIRPGQSAHLLHGPEQATYNWLWQAPSSRLVDVDGPLACAATLELAQGHAMPQAIETALKKAVRLSSATFQPGMGYRIINRSAHE